MAAANSPTEEDSDSTHSRNSVPPVITSTGVLFASSAGQTKKGFLKESVGDELHTIMSGIKSVFDPHGIMNPGKVV